MNELDLARKEVLLDSIISKEDSSALNHYLKLLQEKYGLEDVRFKVSVESSKQIPCSAFTRNLGIAESVVKYLRENLGFSNSEVSMILDKSQKNASAIYGKARKKYPKRFKEDSKLSIPISVLENKGYTTFESIVAYLKNSGLTNHEIAVQLNRDDKTIWTELNRIKKKNG